MSVLITGGAGLLGAELVRQLLARGEERPVVLDIAAEPARLAAARERIEYIRADLADAAALTALIRRVRPRQIYHVGAMLGGPCEADPLAATQVNALGTLNLLEAARHCEGTQVLFASSGATFGLDLPEPVLRDDSLQRPVSFYGVTKLFGEGAGLFYKRKYGLDYRSIRFPSIVGVGMREGGLVAYTSALIEQSLKGEPCVVGVYPDTAIAVVHVRDAARAMIELAEAPLAHIRTVNYLIDGVKPRLSAGQLAEVVRAKVPGAEIRFEPVAAWQPLLDLIAVEVDDGAARAEWGWQPEYDYARMVDLFSEELGGDVTCSRTR